MTALATEARGALAALNGTDLATVEASVARGDALVEVIRDRARGFRRKVFAVLSFGWDGAARTWARYERACILLAALATPLVVSVHSVVSTDFATSLVPGWHTTVFPPYFVIGALYSGVALVIPAQPRCFAPWPALQVIAGSRS